MCIIDEVKSKQRVLIAVFCAVLLAAGGIPVKAQQTGGYYFTQTRHNVIEEFWTYYQSITDAAVIFGMPITEQFPSADGSKLIVQYFEKVRFELNPNQPVGQRVALTALGSKLYQPGKNPINLTTPGACRVINGFGVCYEFLAFFDQHGGQARFGNPISPFVFQTDGRLVQNFERARFEWHPELPARQNVQLADLGRIYFNTHEDVAWLNPALPVSNIPILQTPPLSLRTMAFVARAVTQPTDSQKIYIIVQDQALGPVSGATGNVTVRLAKGQSLTYPVTTDINGVGVIQSVTFSNQPPGSLVIVDVKMSYSGLDSYTTTSFRIWR